MSNVSPSALPLARVSDRAFFTFNAILSATALAFLTYILVIRRGSGDAVLDLRFLPPVNASLNALAAMLLTAGYVAVRKRLLRLHKYLMVSAFAASSLFLVCYLAYHYVHGDTHYRGVGAIRAVYFSILISHIVLSASIVPLALTSFYFAYKRAFTRHKKVAKVTLPIWLYVSVTGVLIFFFLRGTPPAH